MILKYRSCSHKHKAQGGQAIIIIALSAIVLLAITAIGIDGSRLYSMRRVAQNAADEAALSGVYYIARNPSATVKQVLAQINTVAEANQVPDTDGIAGNNINNNVSVHWLTLNADNKSVTDQGPLPNAAYSPQITTATLFSGTSPALNTTVGFQVQVTIPFTGFLSQFVGQSGLAAQASAQARVNTLGLQNLSGGYGSVWIGGGGTCNDLQEGEGGHIAFDFINDKSTKYLGAFTVNGSLSVGTANSTDFYGNVTVKGIYTGPYSSGNVWTAAAPPDDPFAGHGNKYHNSSQFLSGAIVGDPTHTTSDSWPPLFINQDGSQLDARYFAPGSSSGYATYLNSLSPSMYKAFDEDAYGGNTAALVTAINTYLMTGARASYPDKGVVYIYSSSSLYPGDLTLTSDQWGQVTLVMTGRFNLTGTNNSLGYSLYGGNLSILAGYDWSKVAGHDASDKCASDANDWVFLVSGNNVQATGIVYLPYGQFQVTGQTSGGSQFSGGIVAYSARFGDTGNGNQANSWQFNFNPALYNRLYPGTQLMGN